MVQGEGERLWQVTCQCGWRTRGTREVVVPAVQDHGRTAHGLEVTPEKVEGQMTPVDGAGAS